MRGSEGGSFWKLSSNNFLKVIRNQGHQFGDIEARKGYGIDICESEGKKRHGKCG